MSPRTGRRSSDAKTREAIVAAARAAFAADGYAGTSLRAVARAAGVDPALVHHYFEDKPALFAEALSLPLQPATIAQVLSGGDPAQAGARLAALFVSLWENPATQPAMLALVRGAATEEHAAAMLRGFVTDGILRHVAAAIGGDDAQLRAALMGAQLVGMAVLRYIVRLPALADATADDVIAHLAPILQFHLTKGATIG